MSLDNKEIQKIVKKYGNNNNIDVHIVEPVTDQDMIISSTHIRNLINSGFVRRASFELGWVFGF